MTYSGYRWAASYRREDGTLVDQRPLELDWGPAKEWARFTAVRAGQAGEEAFVRKCLVEPLWHADRGAPHVSGFRVRLFEEADGSEPTPGEAEVGADFPTSYFADAARAGASNSSRRESSRRETASPFSRSRFPSMASGIRSRGIRKTAAPSWAPAAPGPA